MKTNLRLLVSLGVLCSGANMYAQEFSVERISKEVYTSTDKTFPLANQQKVQEAFRSLSTVYTLDFSGATAKSLSPALEEETAKTVSNAGFVNYSNQAAISELLALQPEALSVKIPFKGELLTADLVKADLFGDGFKVTTSDPSAVTDSQPGVYYQGTIRGKNTVVTFSFFQNEFSALILTNEASNSIIEAGYVRDEHNTGGTHIIYTDDDLKVDFSHPCRSEALEQYGIALDKLAGEQHEQATEKALLKCVTYFWETSYNMYQSFGSTAAVTNYMTTLFNNFQVIYNNESIGSKLNQLYIWTTADSYNNDLNTFSANRSGFGANLATLFSTTGGGGVAWLDVVCGSSEYYKHGFCGSVGSSIPAVPNYSWPVNVSTHEVGHNLGSPHTHACTWTGGAIDGCGPTAGYSEGCTAALPSGGGTIMSYCHLVSSVGMNFNNGFGPQPGNLIRSRVNSCISLTCETGGTGSTCATAFEPNETQAAALTILSGTTNSAAISSATDNDYYKIVTGSTSNITYNLVGPSGVDYDMVIYNSGGTQIGAGTSGTATETVVLNSQAAGTYYIRAYGYNGANSTTCYTIKATAVGASCGTAFEPNETQVAAATIVSGALNSAAISTSTDVDYYRIVTSATANNTYSLVGPSGVDFDMYVYNSAGTQIGSGTSGSATETVTINSQAAGTYYVRIIGYNGANSATCYTLRVAPAGSSFAATAPEATEGLSVYPNPTTDKLYLGGTYSGKITNQLGQTVMVFDGSELSLKELQAGVYLLQVAGSANLYRIIKE